MIMSSSAHDVQRRFRAKIVVLQTFTCIRIRLVSPTTASNISLSVDHLEFSLGLFKHLPAAWSDTLSEGMMRMRLAVEPRSPKFKTTNFDLPVKSRRLLEASKGMRFTRL